MHTNKLKISIITPKGKVFEGNGVKMVLVHGVEGDMTILPNHEPILTKIQHGEVIVKLEGEEKSFSLFEGFLNLDDKNQLTIMADVAQRVEELNVAAIQKARDDAQKALSEKEKLSVTEILRAETAIRRAIMELKIAEKKNRH